MIAIDLSYRCDCIYIGEKLKAEVISRDRSHPVIGKFAGVGVITSRCFHIVSFLNGIYVKYLSKECNIPIIESFISGKRYLTPSYFESIKYLNDTNICNYCNMKKLAAHVRRYNPNW